MGLGEVRRATHEMQREVSLSMKKTPQSLTIIGISQRQVVDELQMESWTL